MNRIKKSLIKNKKKIKLAFKITGITMAILLFISSMFIAMNETKRAIDGQALSVSATDNGYMINIGDNSWQIEKDEDKIARFKEFIKKNYAIYPYGLQIIKCSDELSKIVADLIQNNISGF